VAQQEVRDPSIKAAFPIRTIDWFRSHAYKYDRVLYQVGNSVFHQHMFGLLPEIPGVVVLHDFFLSGVLAYMDAYGLVQNGWASELYASHGYEAVRQRFHAKDCADVTWRYPCSLRVLQQAQGIIVHSSNSLRLAKQWYGDNCSDWAVIPLLRNSRIDWDNIAARKALGLGVSDFLVCAFGLLASSKLNQRLLRAWLQSRLARDRNCHLMFVGENDGGDYGHELLGTIRRNRAEENIRITGWLEMDVFRQYLAAADIAVQLRTLSRGETSAAVCDCMNFGLATIVNANGSMADLDDNAVWKLPDDFTDAQLIEALETLWKDAELRKKLGTRAREIIVEKHNPRTCAAQYHEAIERFNISSASGTRALTSAIAGLECTLDDCELTNISEAIARSVPQPFTARQLLVDISGLIRRDAGSDIERVARSVLRKWLVNAPSRIRVEPVYATENGGYRYARRFTLDFLGCPRDVLEDDPLEFSAGDIFLGLDSQLHVTPARRTFYHRLRGYGVQVYFVAYDLVSTFIDPVAQRHPLWLEIVAESDGVFCVSKTVADELAAWINANRPKSQRPFKIECLHSDTDIEGSICRRKGFLADTRVKALDAACIQRPSMNRVDRGK
jgi:glycosyltransferase involved in cell wall biosynthesis